MKNRSLILLCLLASLSPFAARNSMADVNVNFSVGVFEGPLSACGYWVDRAPYGRCWRPAYVSSNWRPYCNGYWMWSDAGWYWVSDEPWAWACYHYGRWVQDPWYGWVWVPDTVWGPSWVAWRGGDDYVGWAPLSPECEFGPRGEFVYREGVIRPSAFVFVDVRHFSEPVSPHTVIINNTTIVNKTVNITQITRVNNVVVNNGPNLHTIQRFNQRPLTVAPKTMPHWTGYATPRHAAPEVLQPSAVSRPRESEPRFNTGVAQAGPSRPGTPGTAEPPVVRGTPSSGTGMEDHSPRSQRTEHPPIVQVPPANDHPAIGQQRVGNPHAEPFSGAAHEQMHQNFDPRVYPYGKVQGAYPEPPKSAPTEPHARSGQPAREESGAQPDRGQHRSQGY